METLVWIGMHLYLPAWSWLAYVNIYLWFSLFKIRDPFLLVKTKEERWTNEECSTSRRMTSVKMIIQLIFQRAAQSNTAFGCISIVHCVITHQLTRVQQWSVKTVCLSVFKTMLLITLSELAPEVPTQPSTWPHLRPTSDPRQCCLNGESCMFSISIPQPYARPAWHTICAGS